jgi:hypothetical protein
MNRSAAETAVVSRRLITSCLISGCPGSCYPVFSGEDASGRRLAPRTRVPRIAARSRLV